MQQKLRIVQFKLLELSFVLWIDMIIKEINNWKYDKKYNSNKVLGFVCAPDKKCNRCLVKEGFI